MNKFIIQELTQIVDSQWRNNMQGVFFEWIREHKIDNRLYRDLMLEIYHYTKHNSINQAIASINVPEEATGLLRFVYRHSEEELGHENMVLHDLESIGILDRGQLSQAPLPATEALIGYLYAVAIRYGAIARLGYSFWAESAYHYIDEVINKIAQDLSLQDNNLTFFIAHQNIDIHHAEQVNKAIGRYCTDPKDCALIKKVASTTLYLTGKMLDGVVEKYLQHSIANNES